MKIKNLNKKLAVLLLSSAFVLSYMPRYTSFAEDTDSSKLVTEKEVNSKDNSDENKKEEKDTDKILIKILKKKMKLLIKYQ